MAPKNGNKVIARIPIAHSGKLAEVKWHNEDFPAHMRPHRLLCGDCGLRRETIKLVNGEDVQHLCAGCLQEQIYDMVLNNDTFSIANRDDTLVCL